MNKLITDNLQVLLKEAQSGSESKDKFRAKAYANAIKQIKGLTYELQSGVDALKLQGIGKKIADKIQEIIDTGALHQVSDLGGESELQKTGVLSLFQGIWGVGPVKATELWDAGARTIDDVYAFQSLLNDNQKIGLQYYQDLQIRVPRSNIEPIVDSIKTIIRQINNTQDYNIRARVCGSYRRRAQTCGDMDIAICEQDDKVVLPLIIDKLSQKGIIIEQLGLGPTKFMGITNVLDAQDHKIAFRIDMEFVKMSEWPFALLYFTGSGGFNERQRQVAKKMGYSLSEHGLKNVETGEYVQNIQNEKQIFDFLGMTYLPPWDR